jgi:hypothetical protein
MNDRIQAHGDRGVQAQDNILHESFGGEWSRGFVFPAINRTLEDGKLYTLDPCPNDWYGYWCSQVIEGLCAGNPVALLAEPVLQVGRRISFLLSPVLAKKPFEQCIEI